MKKFTSVLSSFYIVQKIQIIDIVHKKSNSSKTIGLLNTNKQVNQLLQERLKFYISKNKNLEKSLHIVDDNSSICNQDTSKIIKRQTNV